MSLTPKNHQANQWQSVLVILTLLLLLSLNVYFFGDDSSYGPNQITLFSLGIIILIFGSLILKIDYQEMEKKVSHSILASLPACYILLLIGPLISLWIVSGIVPTFMYYGLGFINPSFFLPLSVISCALVSLSIGSSWSTMGTLGVAIIGMGEAMGFPIGMTAGAIISGAYFGDKISPLSDTTNLAPAVSETNLFTHIRYMLYSTIPAILISLVIFFILGLIHLKSSDFSPLIIEQMQLSLAETFNITILLFIAPLLILALIAFKFPPLPVLFIGCLLGATFALIFQPHLLNNQNATSLYQTIINLAVHGPHFNLEQEQLSSLLNRGGMLSMLNTIWLIICAMFFGGAIEVTGVMKQLAKIFLSFVKNTGSLVGTTIAACFTFNFTASDQYLAIVIPGKMFKQTYRDHDLAPENLSRALEDGGTLGSVLIPWNTCGAYASGVLGVSTISYAPYCFFNYLSPVISIFLSSMNIAIAKNHPHNSHDNALNTDGL